MMSATLLKIPIYDALRLLNKTIQMTFRIAIVCYLKVLKLIPAIVSMLKAYVYA